jgi:pimeloyl-ACP methyl ester carboxylesterase
MAGMQDRPQQQWEERYWHSRDGLRLHYRDYPGADDRPPVICLHGLTRNGRDFGSLAARLTGKWRVMVPDLRGRGLSDYDPLPTRYAPPTYVGDILQLMDLLGIIRAVFIGTSLGGLVTIGIAAVAPDRIAGAVLNDVGPQLEPQGLERIRSYVGTAANFHSWEEAARSIAERNAQIHPGYKADDWVDMARRLCRETRGQIRFDYDPAIAINVLAAGSPVDAWPYFRRLSAAPLLIVRGELSDLLSAETARNMVAEHPDAELISIARVGHAPDLDEPEAVGAIERLLTKALKQPPV